MSEDPTTDLSPRDVDAVLEELEPKPIPPSIAERTKDWLARLEAIRNEVAEAEALDLDGEDDALARFRHKLSFTIGYAEAFHGDMVRQHG